MNEPDYRLPSSVPATPSVPWDAQIINRARPWQASGDVYHRAPSGGGNPAQFPQDLAQPGQGGASAPKSQAPGIPDWQSRPGPSSTPRLSSRGSPPATHSNPFQPVSSPSPDAGQQNQQAAFAQDGRWNKAIPHDRAAFMNFLQLWFIQTRRNTDAIPKIGNKLVDLHHLYIEVEALGGVEKVQATGLWRLVAVKMGYMTHEQYDPQLTQTAEILADTYAALLVPFDSFMDRVSATGDSLQNNRLNQRNAGMVPGNGGAGLLGVANYHRALMFLHVTLKDWLPELPSQTKLLRAVQMDIPAMQREGWPPDRIQVVQRFRPVLVHFRSIFIPQQQLHQRAFSRQDMQQPNAQAQAQAAQVQQSGQQEHAYNLRDTGTYWPICSPEEFQRAKATVNSISREIEQPRQYHQQEVPEIQRVQMNQAVMSACTFAVEFERNVLLYYVLFNDEQRTRALIEQAALLREQHRILQSGKQQYIMTLEKVGAVQNTLQMVIHQLKTTYAQRLKQHKERMANLRVGQAGSPATGQQSSAHRVQHNVSQKHPYPHQQQQASTAMSYLSASAGLGGQLPQLVRQRLPSQTQYEYRLPKPGPGNSSMGMASQLRSNGTPGTLPPAGRRKHPKIKLPPQTLDFNISSKRQREDEVPPTAEPILPTTTPLSSKRTKTGFQNDDPLDSMDEALAQLQRAVPDPNDYDIDPDILAQLDKILDGPAPGPSGALGVDTPVLKKNMADDAAQIMEMDNAISDAQSVVDTQPGQISCEEIFQRLIKHGCVDLSSHMDPEQYSPGLIIGGAFGDIWKGKLRDGTEVAIKVWRFSSLLHNGWKFVKRAMREIYYWSKAKHEYVQELMGVILFQGRLGMVSRWMEHGNLREYICKNPSVDRYALCMQVATGIAYLHGQAMVHGDLKGLNVLVSCDGVARLSDFDHSIMLGCSLVFSDTSKLGGGTTRWMAPELILEDDCSRSTYTDVYSLGMTMLEIITGTPPYYPQFQEDVQVIRAIMKKKLPTRPMDHLGDNLRGNRMWELLLSCWNYEPLARPKATEVIESLRNIIASPARSPI